MLRNHCPTGSKKAGFILMTRVAGFSGIADTIWVVVMKMMTGKYDAGKQ